MSDFSVKKNVNELIPDQIDRFRLLKLVNDLYSAVNTGTVIGIQTIPISSTKPTSGQVLEYNGTSWVPSSALGPFSSLELTSSGDVFWANNGVGTGNLQLTQDSVDAYLDCNHGIRIKQDSSGSSLANYGFQGQLTATTLMTCHLIGDTNNRLIIDVNGGMQWGPGNATTDIFMGRASAGLLGVNVADFQVHTAGRGLRVAEGSNAKQGTATLSSGTVTVANTSVTANSRIFLQAAGLNASTAIGELSITTITASTSFVITSYIPGGTSTQTGDLRTIFYEIFEPG